MQNNKCSNCVTYNYECTYVGAPRVRIAQILTYLSPTHITAAEAKAFQKVSQLQNGHLERVID